MRNSAATLGAVAAAPAVVAAASRANESPLAAARKLLTIDWSKVISRSNTVFALQYCVEPPMTRTGAVWKAGHDIVRHFNGHARLQTWFPYPRLAVAALEPPAHGRTSWDFSLLDPIVLDFHQAQQGRPLMINFELPRWLMDRRPHRIPDDPSEIDWFYGRFRGGGDQFVDPTLEEATDYFRRVAEWYIKGGFVDEYGKLHQSGHQLRFDYWEILNEQDDRFEFELDPDTYTRFYDKLVAKLRPLDPQMKFAGPSLRTPESLHYIEHFLNPANHVPGTPIDMVTYHEYIVQPRGGTVEDWHRAMFAATDRFLRQVRKIDRIRKRLSPHTRVGLTEMGVMNGESQYNTLAARQGRPTDYSDPVIDDAYWTLAASIHAYSYLGAMRNGVDYIAASELIDYPGQYAGTNLIHWRTGEPNAMYRVIKMFRDELPPGCDLLDTTSGHPDVAAQAFATSAGRKLLLINKTPAPIELAAKLPGGGKAQWVDRDTQSSPPRSAAFSGGSVRLGAQAVMFISW